MSKTSTKPEPVYELKHRIVGAVTLVAVAVIIIPLFLSEPSVEANNSPTSAANGEGDNGFKSRIVPLNLNNVNGNKEIPTEVTGTEVSKPALVEVGNAGSTTATAPAQNSGEISTSIVMTQQPKTAPASAPKKKIADVVPASTEAQSKTEPKTKPTEKKVAAVKLPEETNQAGWVVRVGTFSKKANVDSVSTLLSNSGFKPRKSAVTTSLGNSTRVWLGPFAQRETADKISDRLKSLIGEKGYVTRNNS